MFLQRVADWVQSKISTAAQRIILYILSAGPVPRHVAFIMDGNRRYARARHQKVELGHFAGYLALRRVLEICMRLNIRCVSVYAFAMDNFKRPPHEVDALLDLASTRLMELCQHGDLLDQYGVRLNVIGRKELFPESVRLEMERAEKMTRNNKRFILNVCVAYASRDEITGAVESCVRKSLTLGSDAKPITVEDIESHLMMSPENTPPLDILIRSSGVTRLSDFMLWQCCENTQIHFCETLWPDIGLFDLFPILMNFQRKVWSEGKGSKF